MKAICVTPTRTLEVRDIPIPTDPPPGHVLVDMEACAINHGDKAFLARHMGLSSALPMSRHDVWGASGAGLVVEAGAGVPVDLVGRRVAIYRSLGSSPETVGLWCERAQVSYTSCMVLPAHASSLDYCGSLVNIITAYSFLREVQAAGHEGIVITAGRSATGRVLAFLARQSNITAISLMRSATTETASRGQKAGHVILTTGANFEHEFTAASAEFKATAVFDGVGGALIGRIAPMLPTNTTVYVYGLLGGATPASLQASLFLTRNLAIRKFSNFESQTVKDPHRLRTAFEEFAGLIDDPLFATRVGREFSFAEIEPAMTFEMEPGVKAILRP